MQSSKLPIPGSVGSEGPPQQYEWQLEGNCHGKTKTSQCAWLLLACMGALYFPVHSPFGILTPLSSPLGLTESHVKDLDWKVSSSLGRGQYEDHGAAKWNRTNLCPSLPTQQRQLRADNQGRRQSKTFCLVHQRHLLGLGSKRGVLKAVCLH